MTTTTRPRRAFRHELLLYDGMADLVPAAVARVNQGCDEGRRPLVMGDEEFVAAVVGAADPGIEIDAVPRDVSPRRAAAELRSFRTILDDAAAGSVGMVIVNQFAVPDRDHWSEALRYEAAADVVLSPYDSWGICAYERPALGPEQVDDFRSTHPLVGATTVDSPGPLVVDPADRVRRVLSDAPAPRRGTADLRLLDPDPAHARRVVAGLVAAHGRPTDAVDALGFAVSESVANTVLHGRSPVEVAVWVGDRTTVTVTDRGPGPADPLVGLVPPAGPLASGAGAWLVHQLVDVRHFHGPDEYTVELSV